MNPLGRSAVWALGGLSILLTACPSPGADAFSSVDIAEEVAAFLEEDLAAIDVRDTAGIGQAYVE